MNRIGVALAALLTLASSGCDTRHRGPSNNIGKPFRVSDAVTGFCAMKPRHISCDAFDPLLSELLAESRDTAWAVPMERRLTKWMLVDGQQWADIRALECRRTLCAVEYAVPVEDVEHHLDGDAELDRLMNPVGGLMAPELVSGASAGNVVSVLIWRRRS